MGLGIVLVQAASPAVAERIGLGQLPLRPAPSSSTLAPACLLMVGVSLLSPRGVRRTAVIGFIIFTILLALTMVIGFEIKGARRWIHVPGLSIQPSEFVKPAFAVVAAWLFAHGRTSERFPGAIISIVLYLMVVGAADDAAGLRHDLRRVGRVVRPVLPGRAADHPGRHHGRRGHRRPDRRLHVLPARDEPRQPVPRPCRRRQLSRSHARWKPSRTAARSAPAPARAASR